MPYKTRPPQTNVRLRMRAERLISVCSGILADVGTAEVIIVVILDQGPLVETHAFYAAATYKSRTHEEIRDALLHDGLIERQSTDAWGFQRKGTRYTLTQKSLDFLVPFIVKCGNGCVNGKLVHRD